VFQRGKLVEQGKHEELLRRGGLYAKLHRLHFARADELHSVPPPPA
jgi:ABC-type multidrug transport system fused ATPase/permease subunit